MGDVINLEDVRCRRLAERVMRGMVGEGRDRMTEIMERAIKDLREAEQLSDSETKK